MLFISLPAALVDMPDIAMPPFIRLMMLLIFAIIAAMPYADAAMLTPFLPFLPIVFDAAFAMIF